MKYQIRLIISFVLMWYTLRVPHGQQDLLTHTEKLRWSPVFGEIHVDQSLVFFLVLKMYAFICLFFLFFFAIVLSVYFRFLKCGRRSGNFRFFRNLIHYIFTPELFRARLLNKHQSIFEDLKHVKFTLNKKQYRF